MRVQEKEGRYIRIAAGGLFLVQTRTTKHPALASRVLESTTAESGTHEFIDRAVYHVHFNFGRDIAADLLVRGAKTTP